MLELLVLFAENLLLAAHLIEVLRLHQHPAVGASQSCDGEKTHNRRRDESVCVTHRNGQLVELALLISAYVNNVSTFLHFGSCSLSKSAIRPVPSGPVGSQLPPKILLNLLGQKISRLQILNYAPGEIRNELNNFWLEP